MLPLQTKNAAHMKRHSFTAIIGFCISLVLVTLIGGSWLVLERSWQTALSAAHATLHNAALVVESVVNRQLLQVDGALVSLPTLLTTISKGGPNFDNQDAGRLLRGLNFQTFAFRDIIILRPDGSIWASARPNPWNGSFPVAALNETPITAEGTARVLGPLRNSVTGDWVVLVARRLTIPGAGALDAVAEVPLPLISVLFSAIGETPGLRIFVERRDGRLFVSQPYDERQVGKFRLAAISQSPGANEEFPEPDNATRTPTIGVKRSSLYPDVTVSLTLDLKTALTDWVRDRNRLLAVVAFAVVLLSALVLTLNAARKQRERADAERHKAREMLDSAIESMSDGFVMWDAEDQLVTCNEQFRQMYRISSPFIHPGAKFDDIIRRGAKLGQYPQATDDIEAFVEETANWRRHNDGPMERELPDGRWALVTERKTPDGGTVGIRTDITSLKQALSEVVAANERTRNAMEEVQLHNAALKDRDRALQIQNVLFDAALNNMSQGLLMTDGNRNLIVFNERFLVLFAIDAGALVLDSPVDDIFATIASCGGLPSDMVEDIYHRQRGLADARQSGSSSLAERRGSLYRYHNVRLLRAGGSRHTKMCRSSDAPKSTSALQPITTH